MDKLLVLHKEKKDIGSPWLIVSSCDDTRDTIEKLCEDIMGYTISNSPDYLYREYTQLGIGDAKDIREMHSKKGFSDKRIFFIRTYSITNEAQNALLKMLEELNKGTTFFLMVPNQNIILPTLLSRMQVAYEKDGNKNKTYNAGIFMSSSYVDRMSIVKKIIEEKDRENAVYLINSIENLIYKKWGKDKKNTVLKNSLLLILKSREYLHKKGVSIKYPNSRSLLSVILCTFHEL
jgi:hypothetical protein